jgi:hypothetical protein
MGAQRYSLAVAYPANRSDLHREYMRPEQVEATAWSYLAKHRGAGVAHFDGTAGAGTVVESYIYRGPDWRMTAADGRTVVVKSGDWLIGVLWDPAVWELIESGRLTGVSIQGSAKRQAMRPVASRR